MARGRWRRDDDGWYSNEGRGRSQSRGRSDHRGNGGGGGGGGGGKNNGNNSGSTNKGSNDYRRECERLRKELDDARKRNERLGHLQAPRVNAKEGPQREGDWTCSVCNFGTNRHVRLACYRCGAAKGHSFPPGSPHVQAAALAASAALHPSPQPAPTSPTYAAAVMATSTASATSSPSSTRAPLLVPGFAGAPPAAAAGPAAAAAVPGQVVMGVKPLKSRLDTLLEARAALAVNSYCTEALAAIDAQIGRARAELATAQPLEVALKSTLGAVATARQALQRAEAKTSKLEQQVVTAVSAYETAAAETELCRKQLAEAEAATARTAGGHVDLHRLLGNDPGAAWASFRAACEARCAPGAAGVDDALRVRAAAAFAEMQSVCALLPCQPPSSSCQVSAASTAVPTAAAAAAGVEQSPPSAGLPEPSVVTSVEAAGAGMADAAVHTSGGVFPSQLVAVDAGAVAAAAITAALEQQRRSSPSPPPHDPGSVSSAEPAALLQPSSAEVPSLFEAATSVAEVAAPQPPRPAQAPSQREQEIIPPLAGDELSAFQRQLGTAEREARSQQAIAAYTAHVKMQHVHAAAAAALVQGDPAAVPVPSAEGSSGQSPAPPAHDAHDGDGGGGSQPQPPAKDDTMGGAAEVSAVNKRSHDAIVSAKAIAARAKAKV